MYPPGTKTQRITIEHTQSGKQMKVSTGYSWSLFFFSFLTLLYRKDWKMLGIAFFSVISLMIWLEHLIHPMIVFQFFFAILSVYYNPLYLKRALHDKWVPANEESRNHLYQCKLVSSPCPKQSN